MRIIHGEYFKPESSHILILRGIDSTTPIFFKKHVEDYPNWGIFICHDKGQSEAVKYCDFSSCPPNDAIHTIDSTIPCEASDEDVIKYVFRVFPPYSEDNDPVIMKESPTSSDTDYADAILSGFPFSSLGKGVSDKLKSLYERPILEDYIKDARTETLPVKLLTEVTRVDLRSLTHVRDLDDYLSSIEKDIMRRMFSELQKARELWEFEVTERDDGTVEVACTLGVSPLRTLSSAYGMRGGRIFSPSDVERAMGVGEFADFSKLRETLEKEVIKGIEF